ncbi:MAG: ASCH domain-containing protein [Elusimicrobia bacterium]|nr:ASCH domain-containing protein [Elusimicrobiota bacterium]
MPTPDKTPEVREFWRAFRQARGVGHDDYDVVAFGDGPDMADALAELVVSGPKRATAGLARDFAAGGEAMPRLGGHVVLIDGKGTPRCVWQTTDVVVKPLSRVDAAFAWDEGEGDRTLASWLDGHRRFFARQAAREKFDFHDNIETVCERFKVVWPPEIADK